MKNDPRSTKKASLGRTLERDARELHTVLSELVRVYQFRDRKRICYYDISVTQCYAISALVGHDSMTLNGLAAVREKIPPIH